MGWHVYCHEKKEKKKQRKTYSRKKLMKRDSVAQVGKDLYYLKGRRRACVKLVSHDVTYSSVHICDLFPVYVNN